MATEIRSPAFLVSLVVLLAATGLVSGTLPLDKTKVQGWFNQNVRPCTERKSTVDRPLMNAEQSKRVIKVMKDGSGDCKTITEAINKIPPGNTNRVIVDIGPGVYDEQVKIDKSKPFITLHGSPNNMPKLICTKGGSALDVQSDYFMAANCIISNPTKPDGKSTNVMSKGAQVQTQAPTQAQAPAQAQTQASGPGQTQASEQGQTQVSAPGQTQASAQGQIQFSAQGQLQAQIQVPALKVSGDKAAFYGCQILGLRNTLNDDQGRHFFKDCTIEGASDFIYGNGKSLYLNSKVHALEDNGSPSMPVQAKGSTSGEPGFVFAHCDITGAVMSYLKKAMSTNPDSVFAYSNIGAFNSAAWLKNLHAMHGAPHFQFLEYMNNGPGAVTMDREKLGQVLSGPMAQSLLSLDHIKASQWLLPAP